MKKKSWWRKALVIGLIWAGCGVMGYFLGMYIEATTPESYTTAQEMGYMLLVMACVLVGGYIQIILHEGGHLVGGLLTGYQFSSFRVGSAMLLRENGKLVWRKFTLAGTGGQCLMIPPEMVDGGFPVFLYNLGGPLANLLVSGLTLGLFFLLPAGTVASNICLGLGFSGVYLAVLNGVPIRVGGIDNDGRNALSLGKNPDALRAFWLQMKMNEQISRGMRLKDMPEEWFEVPSDEAMGNPMVAVLGVFACNRLMDQHRFEQADVLMSRLMALDSGISDLHRNLLTCDRIFVELTGQCRGDVLDGMYSKEQKQFMKAMKKFPTVLRTEYAYYLLDAKDMEKAAQIKEKFEKMAKTYPYPSDIQSERELMEIAANTLNA